MSEVESAPDRGPITIDEFSARLGVLRLGRGRPSYAEIAARIAERRVAAGVGHASSRIARSSVYDVFRTGRAELDLDLVEEVLVALLLDEPEVERWMAAARRAVPAPASTVAGGTGTAGVAGRSGPADFAGLTGLSDFVGLAGRAGGVDAAPTSPPHRSRLLRPFAPLGAVRRVGLLLLGCLLLNLVGRQLVVTLDLPLHLDMSGTAIAAILAGPWWGALVGLATNGAGSLASGASSLPFAAVNVAGALVWGYGVRTWGMGRSLPRFFTLNLLCATICSLVATPIVLAYREDIVHGSDPFLDNAVALLQVAVVGVFLGNLLISLVDKTLSGVVALLVAERYAPSAVTGAHRETTTRPGLRHALTSR